MRLLFFEPPARQRAERKAETLKSIPQFADATAYRNHPHPRPHVATPHLSARLKAPSIFRRSP